MYKQIGQLEVGDRFREVNSPSKAVYVITKKTRHFVLFCSENTTPLALGKEKNVVLKVEDFHDYLQDQGHSDVAKHATVDKISDLLRYFTELHHQSLE